MSNSKYNGFQRQRQRNSSSVESTPDSDNSAIEITPVESTFIPEIKSESREMSDSSATVTASNNRISRWDRPTSNSRLYSYTYQRPLNNYQTRSPLPLPEQQDRSRSPPSWRFSPLPNQRGRSRSPRLEQTNRFYPNQRSRSPPGVYRRSCSPSSDSDSSDSWDCYSSPRPDQRRRFPPGVYRRSCSPPSYSDSSDSCNCSLSPRPYRRDNYRSPRPRHYNRPPLTRTWRYDASSSSDCNSLSSYDYDDCSSSSDYNSCLSSYDYDDCCSSSEYYSCLSLGGYESSSSYRSRSPYYRRRSISPSLRRGRSPTIRSRHQTSHIPPSQYNRQRSEFYRATHQPSLSYAFSEINNPPSSNSSRGTSSLPRSPSPVYISSGTTSRSSSFDHHQDVSSDSSSLAGQDIIPDFYVPISWPYVSSRSTASLLPPRNEQTTLPAEPAAVDLTGSSRNSSLDSSQRVPTGRPSGNGRKTGIAFKSGKNSRTVSQGSSRRESVIGWVHSISSVSNITGGLLPRLPSHWKVKMTDSGEIYYINLITEERSFTRPLV